MLTLHEMAILRYIPKDTNNVLGLGGFRVSAVYGAGQLLEGDPTYHECLGHKVIDNLLAKKLIEKTKWGLLRTREGQEEYSATAKQLQTLAADFVGNSFR